MRQAFNSIYVGIVIQNNDPDKQGRCKIFVPHLTSYLSDEWLTKDKKKDRSFKFVNGEASSDLLEILPRLKQVLPWANYAGPIFGGNSSGRYNATTKQGYTDDHNDWKDGSPATSQRPASRFSNSSPPKDAFTDPEAVNVTNPMAYAYSTSDYSTLASGMFSIPNVGAHVWCFFEGGDINCPVYFASSYGAEDVKRIYTTNKHTSNTLSLTRSEQDINKNDAAVDYPGDYENVADTELNADNKIFRSKHTINSNKHTIEMIDTDKHEILKLSHYNGAFKEFTNESNIEFAPYNDQKLVLGNSFETIRRTFNLHVEDDKNVYVYGDTYENIGNYDFSVTKRIKKIMDNIHQYIQLFDVRRTDRFMPGAQIPNPNPEFVSTPDEAEAGNIFAAEYPNLISPLQKREKASRPFLDNTNELGFTVCPLCKNEPYNFNEALYLLGLIDKRVVITSAPKIAGFGLNCLTPQFAAQIVQDLPSVRLPLNVPSFFDLKIAAQLTRIQERGYIAGAKCDICNSDLLLAPTKRVGYSPSSQGGDFENEIRKLPGGELDKVIEAAGPALIELERQLSGGDKISNINRNKIETVGTVMNDLPSLRVDPVGKLRAENVFVAPEAVYQSYRPAPHIEPVTVMDVPGGDYIITATNKYKLIVGANGINIKTFGIIDIYGSMVDVAGQQLNICSQYETNIDGGERLSLRARKIALTPKEHSPILVDGALHVARNAIVQGGMFVNGQFGTPAIASMREYGETSDALWDPPSFAGTVTDTVTEGVGAAAEEATADLSGLPGGYSFVACGITEPIPAATGAPLGARVTVLIPSHTHLYERPPSQLFNSLQALRMFFADPNGVPTSSGGGSASINDVKRMTAATPVNDTATGEAKTAASDYRDSLRGKIQSHIRTSSEWSEIDTDSIRVSLDIINPTRFVEGEDGGGAQVHGFMTAIFRRNTGTIDPEQESAGGIARYNISFKINIDRDTNEFISEVEPPKVRQLSGTKRSIGLD